jgi:ribosomal protein S15P/S13E
MAITNITNEVKEMRDHMETCNKKEDQMERLIHMNERLNLVLGYAMGFIFNSTLKKVEDELKYDWLVEAVENLLYLDKPLPRMP